MRTVIFLSGLDFKERSIQVIKKTPENYVSRGWDVRYLVTTNPYHEDYKYEPVINPPGIRVTRIAKPLSLMAHKWSGTFIGKLLGRASTFLSILKLAVAAWKELRLQPAEVVYGYEAPGILAANLVRLLTALSPNRPLRVARFQGVAFVNLTRARVGPWASILSHWQDYLAYFLPADVCIMTNDGTRGRELFEQLGCRNSKIMHFWPNGVETVTLTEGREQLLSRLGIPACRFYVLTSCRLVDGKGLPNALRTIRHLVHDENFRDVHYLVAGGGPLQSSLETQAKELSISEHVSFLGPLLQSEVQQLLCVVDACLLTYEYSNVGNPLLEAIAARKLIFTLNTDDTSNWITHERDGFIFDVDSSVCQRIAKALAETLPNPRVRQQILEGMETGNGQKIWSWEQRLNAEVDVIEAACSKLASHQSNSKG